MNFGSGNINSWSRYQKDLIQSHEASSFRLSLGLPQWGEKMWRGDFYPVDLVEKDFLPFYSQALDCVEVSSTFYAPVSRERMQSWASKVPDSFRFIVKWPQSITHDRGLVQCSDLTAAFLDSIEALEHRCGATLLQLPASFTRNSHRELYYFLISLPKDLPLVLEFRHASWFEQGRLYPKLFDFLFKSNIGMTVSDTPQGEDVFHQSFPGKINLLRYLSDDQRDHDQRRLAFWKEQLHMHKPGHEFYLTFHQAKNDSTPELLDLFDDHWSKRLSALRQDKQQTLF